MEQVHFRFAQAGDEQLILDFICQLAAYEHAEDRVVATAEQLHEQLFVHKHAEVLLAYQNEDAVGFALFFHNFSTWLGKAGIYLEDLFVVPEARGHGVGKALLVELARIAQQRNCGRLEWACLDWNTPSIDFYTSLGAQAMDEWTTYRLEGETLANLANG